MPNIKKYKKLDIENYPNGKIKREGNYKNGKKNGEWYLYHPNGNFSEEMNYIDGKLNGKYIRYADDGGIIEEGQYKDNERIGIWANKCHHTFGVMRSVYGNWEEGEYINDLGEGKWKVYIIDFHSKRLVGTINYKNGQRHGTLSYWGKNRDWTKRVKKYEYYKDGERIDKALPK